MTGSLVQLAADGHGPQGGLAQGCLVGISWMALQGWPASPPQPAMVRDDTHQRCRQVLSGAGGCRRRGPLPWRAGHPCPPRQPSLLLPFLGGPP